MNEKESREVVEHILRSENKLLERLVFYVKDRGFDKYVPPLIESWRLAAFRRFTVPCRWPGILLSRFRIETR